MVAVCLVSWTISAVATAAAAPIEEEDLVLVYGDKSFVSIATGSRQLINRAPSVATVITAEEIRTMGAVDLDEVLETVPGLQVNRSAILYNSIYTIRGIGGAGPSNPQVLMLLNGIPMTSSYNGDKGGLWAGYPVEHIARIEIIRGPGSALYGADAYAGVINIITKTADDTPGTELGARAGTFDTWDTWVQQGSKLGKLHVAGYLRAGHTDGQHEEITKDAAPAATTTSPGPVNTGRDSVDANLDLSYDKWRWRSGYKYRDHIGGGVGVASALDPDHYGRSERINTDLSWTDPQIAKDWGLGFMASYLYYSERTPEGIQLFPPGTLGFPNGIIGGPNRWEKQYRLSLFTTYTGFTDHRLRVGVGHDDLDLYRTSTYKNYLLIATPPGFVNTGPVQNYNDIQPHIRPQRRTIDYVYAQDEWQLANDWSLTAGVRHDRYSDFGNTTNPRVALVWDIAYNLTGKLLYGEAFRAPSFNEQYGINPVINGNPNLRPETISTEELALAWQARPDTQLNMSVFRYRMKNIIRGVTNPTPNTGTTLQNTGNQHGSGMELEAIWDYSRSLRLSGNYSHQESIDDSTSRDAGYAPHNQTYARLDWRFASGWLLSNQANWIAGRRRAPGDNRPAVPDYTTVDVNTQFHTKGDRWHFMFAVRNLFDEDAREPSLAPGSIPNDLPLAGRSYLLEARYRL
jgi:outer membrane receptor for ferrienterochelin and colicin